MTVVETTYLTAGGRSRRRKGRIDTSQPTFLVNGGDRQAHSLVNDPLFIQAVPLAIEVWSELTGEWNENDGKWNKPPLTVPAPPVRAEKLRIICEDNAVWPVSCLPFTDELSQQMEMVTTHQEALRLAESREARAAHGNIMLRWGFMAILALCVFLVLLIGAVVVQAKFIDDPELSATARPVTPQVIVRW